MLALSEDPEAGEYTLCFECGDYLYYLDTDNGKVQVGKSTGVYLNSAFGPSDNSYIFNMFVVGNFLCTLEYLVTKGRWFLVARIIGTHDIVCVEQIPRPLDGLDRVVVPNGIVMQRCYITFNGTEFVSSTEGCEAIFRYVNDDRYAMHCVLANVDEFFLYKYNDRFFVNDTRTYTIRELEGRPILSTVN